MPVCFTESKVKTNIQINEDSGKKNPKEEADAAYRKYLDASKKSGNLYLSSLRQAYYHLSRGRKLLDIYEVFHQSGINSEGEPVLAIAPATARVVTLTKQQKGSGTFSGDTKRVWRATKSDVVLPPETFPEWKTEITEQKWTRIKRREIQAHVPLPPVEHLPSGQLTNYFILWEVDEWQERLTWVFTFAAAAYNLVRIRNLRAV